METPGASAPEGTLDGHEPATREPTIDDGPAVLTPESPAPRVPSRRAKTETTSEAPREPAVDPGDDLAEENRLLGRARRALIDEQPARALAQLDEHEQRFPRGVLTEERQALRAIALCEVGREVEGTAAARLFLREHPQAALSHRVRGACLE